MVPVNGTRRQKELCTECCLARDTDPRDREPGDQILKPHCFPLRPSVPHWLNPTSSYRAAQQDTEQDSKTSRDNLEG